MAEDLGRHFKAREIARICYLAGWKDADKLCIAVAVCIAEGNGYEKRRNYNPEVLNPDGTVKTPASVDRGAWMINDLAFPNVPDSVCDDFTKATAVARSIYVGRGGRFTAWAAFNNGQWKGPRALGYAFDGVSNMLREMHGVPVPGG
jgi:hypothetical protein